ncbi:uncharacterized protein [Henckelia pumila]|uniref:uncharacterized protein isoform X2 n=1 Tax=Henckelia pumila TaxID=405737 RepID=UPI003C6E48EE
MGQRVPNLNGGHANNEWLEKELGPQLQKYCGDGTEDLAIVYVDVLVGSVRQLSFRVESTGHLLKDKVYGKFRQNLGNLGKIHCRNKRHVMMIHKLGMHAHNVPYNAELMVRIAVEMLKEACDFKQENLDLCDWEEECPQQMRIQKKTKHDYRFVESNKTTRILQALLESANEHFQRPHSFLFLGLHHAGREDLTVGLSKCYDPSSSISPVIEVELSLCTEADSFLSCKGKSGELFVDVVRARPRSVIVFYDFEMAHISVFSNILSFLDHGFLSDNKGDDVSFHNSIIIFVSECGNKEMISALFGVLNDARVADSSEGLRFRTEFVNRLDEIVLFFPFSLQQFNVVKRLPLRFGLSVESRSMLCVDIHNLFHPGKICYHKKKISTWCLMSLLTKLEAA